MVRRTDAPDIIERGLTRHPFHLCGQDLVHFHQVLDAA